MIIVVKCSNPDCFENFGIEREYAKPKASQATVRISFVCPYCVRTYEVGDKLKLVETYGGVNVSSKGNVEFGGDVAGRDLITRG